MSKQLHNVCGRSYTFDQLCAVAESKCADIVVHKGKDRLVYHIQLPPYFDTRVGSMVTPCTEVKKAEYDKAKLRDVTSDVVNLHIYNKRIRSIVSGMSLTKQKFYNLAVERSRNERKISLTTDHLRLVDAKERLELAETFWKSVGDPLQTFAK